MTDLSSKDIEVRKITLKSNLSNNKSHQFFHILFTAWPDKSIPDQLSQIEPIIKLCIQHDKVLIHCSAGLGRSGVVAALYKIVRGI